MRAGAGAGFGAYTVVPGSAACHDAAVKRWDLVADGMLLLATAAVAVQFAIVPRHFPDLLDGMALFMIASLPAVVLGGVIAHRRPANVVGPLLILVGLLPLLVLAADY